MMMASPQLPCTTTRKRSRANAIRELYNGPPVASAELLFVVNADNEELNRLEVIVNIKGREDLRSRAERFVNAGGDAVGRGPRRVTACAELILLRGNELFLRLVQRRFVGDGMRAVQDLDELCFRITATPIKIYCHNCSEQRQPGQFPPVGSLAVVKEEKVDAFVLLDALGNAHECSIHVGESTIFISGIFYRGEVWRLKIKPPRNIPPPFC